MSQETIDEERREQKIYRELANLSEEESIQDLYEEMDTLSEDLESEQSNFSRKLEDIDDEPNDDVSANPEEPPMNTESEEQKYDGVTQESDIQAKNDEKSGHCDGEQSEKGTVAKYWLLFVGLILVGIGMFGVTGLRLNIVQTYLLGIDNPFPGIGSMEPMGHIGSIIPFAIGIVAIFAWGFLSDKGGESEECCKSAEKGNTLKPTEPTEHAGTVISSGMGIISLFVWGLLPGKAEVCCGTGWRRRFSQESGCRYSQVQRKRYVRIRAYIFSQIYLNTAMPRFAPNFPIIRY